MDCSAAKQKIAGHIEGTLPQDEARLVGEHLATCEQCRMYAADIRKTIEVLKGLEEVPPPPWLTQKVMQRIRAEATPKRGLIQKLFFPLHVKLPIEAAATVLIATAAVLIMKSMGPDLERVAVPPDKPAVQTAPAEKEMLPQDGRGAFKTDRTEQKAEKGPMQEARPKSEISSGGTRMAEQQTVPASPAPALPGPAAPSPAPVMRNVEPGKAKDMAGQEETKQKAAAESARPHRFLEEKRPEMPEITLQVTDVDKAHQEIEVILSKLGGSIKKADKRGESTTLTIELALSERRNFFEQIRRFGKIKEAQPPEVFAGNPFTLILVNQ